MARHLDQIECLAQAPKHSAERIEGQIWAPAEGG